MNLLSARHLSVVALVLFVLFTTVTAGILFPVQPLDTAWQLRLAASLIQAAPFSLVGLTLMHLAIRLDPADSILWRRWRRCSQLAVVAALGFLLLVPLQGMAGFKQGRSFNSAQSTRISSAERRLIVLRQAVASADSVVELNLQLQRLQGPVLGPADLAQPLPLLKAQVKAVLDQANHQISAERQRVPPLNPWTLLPDLLRNTVACLALATGFAALAVRPGCEISLLQEVQDLWWRSRLRQKNHSRPSHRTQDDLDYLGQIISDSDRD